VSPAWVGPSGTILIILGKPKPSQQGVNSPPFQLVLVRLGVTVMVGVGVGVATIISQSQSVYSLVSHDIVPGEHVPAFWYLTHTSVAVL